MKKILIIIGSVLAALTGVAYVVGKVRKQETEKVTSKVEKPAEATT